MPGDTVTKNDLDRFEKRIRFEQRVMDKLEEIKTAFERSDKRLEELDKQCESNKKAIYKVKTQSQVRSAYISGAVAALMIGGKELLKKMFAS